MFVDPINHLCTSKSLGAVGKDKRGLATGTPSRLSLLRIGSKVAPLSSVDLPKIRQFSLRQVEKRRRKQCGEPTQWHSLYM